MDNHFFRLFFNAPKDGFLLLLIVVFLSLFSFQKSEAQSRNIDRILRQIEQYNQELKAFGRLKKVRYNQDLGLKKLENPNIETNYQIGRNNLPNYFDLRVAQPFHLPRYYRTADGVIDARIDEMNGQENEIRQRVLMDALQACFEVIHTNKKLRITYLMLQEVEKQRAAFDTLYALGSVSLLTKERAELNYLHYINEINSLEAEKAELLHHLGEMNGNRHIYLDDILYDAQGTNLPNIDSIETAAYRNDGTLISALGTYLAKKKMVEWQKTFRFPHFNVGYSMQRSAPQESWHGVFGMIEFPLWRSKQAVKTAELDAHYYEYIADQQRQFIRREVLDLYRKLNKLDNYLQTFESSLLRLQNYEIRLGKAVELGEMTIQEFTANLLDFQEMHNEYLNLELEYYHTKAKLMRWFL